MTREIRLQEVKEHNTKDSVWIIIDNNVYDVTKFLAEHPGGEDSLLENAGKDGTEPFNNVGHSTDARELLKTFKIGTLAAEDQCANCSKIKYAGLALLGALLIAYILKKSLKG